MASLVVSTSPGRPRNREPDTVYRKSRHVYCILLIFANANVSFVFIVHFIRD